MTISISWQVNIFEKIKKAKYPNEQKTRKKKHKRSPKMSRSNIVDNRLMHKPQRYTLYYRFNVYTTKGRKLTR